MKKFIFALLILMVGVCLSAAPLHPSGGIPLEIAMSDGYGVATPDTVLAAALPSAGSLVSVLAEAVIQNSPSLASPSDTLTVLALDTGQLKTEAFPQRIDFPLLC